MRKENRIDFPIPDDILVERGFKVPMLGIVCSPGDMIVENINNAPGARYMDTGYMHNIPGLPLAGLQFKRYKVLGVETKKEYIITITDEGIMTETGDPIIGNVERKLIYYRDFHVRQGNISEFLRRFIV